MKTLLVSAVLFLACLSSYAITDDGGGNETTTITKELKQQLNKHMVAPIFCDDAEMIGVVEASFVIDNNGKVKILSLKSNNSALKDYVKRKLMKVQVRSNEGGFWKTTSLSFVFRKED